MDSVILKPLERFCKAFATSKISSVISSVVKKEKRLGVGCWKLEDRLLLLTIVPNEQPIHPFTHSPGYPFTHSLSPPVTQ
jgi:hypothetical protein